MFCEMVWALEDDNFALPSTSDGAAGAISSMRQTARFFQHISQRSPKRRRSLKPMKCQRLNFKKGCKSWFGAGISVPTFSTKAHRWAVRAAKGAIFWRKRKGASSINYPWTEKLQKRSRENDGRSVLTGQTFRFRSMPCWSMISGGAKFTIVHVSGVEKATGHRSFRS
jgi:hypothetical protein